MQGLGKLKVWSAVVLALVGVGGWLFYSRERASVDSENRNAPMQTSSQTNAIDGRAYMSATIESSKAKSEPEGGTLNITIRAVGLNHASQGADQQIGLAVLNEIKSSPYFDSAKAGDVSAEVPLGEQEAKASTIGSPGTFSFKRVTKLKRPLKL